MILNRRTYLTVSPLGGLLFGAFACLLMFPIAAGSYFSAVSLGLLLNISLYFLASHFQQSVWGEWFRGGLVGVNASFNGILIWALTGDLWWGGTLAAIVWLSSSLWFSRSRIFHPVLGWINWVLPMSWLVSLPGLLIYVINVIFAPIGYLHPVLRGLRVRFYTDWRTCTFTQYGGLIRPISGFAGLNMGNFIFINRGWEHLLKHEIGHLFSLAAMGFVFHYVGGIDENYLQARYWEAYAEYLAESYNEASPSALSMWK